MKRNSQISYTKRQVVFARDRWKCVYCYSRADHFKVDERKGGTYILPYDKNGRCFEIDHIIPYCDTKDNSINNLCTACWSCNNKKSNKRRLPKNFPYFKATFDLEDFDGN